MNVTAVMISVPGKLCTCGIDVLTTFHERNHAFSVYRRFYVRILLNRLLAMQILSEIRFKTHKMSGYTQAGNLNGAYGPNKMVT